MAVPLSSWFRWVAARLRTDWLVVFATSSLVACLGVGFGRAFFPPGPHLGDRPAGPFFKGFVRWDGTYYRDIATRGYIHRPGQSPTHFMPGYPLVARGVQAVIGGSIERAMVVASHACFLAALVILARYTERRHGREHPEARSAMLIAIGFFPIGMFFHMGYTESQFLLVCAMLMHLTERGYHPAVVAVVAAAGLITRLVGPALCLPVMWYAWSYGRGLWRSLARVAVCLLISLAGVAALMWYFDQRFGDPILFVRGRQDLWRANPALPIEEKLARLEVLRPVWGMFDQNDRAYWRNHVVGPADLVFRLYLANRLAFLATLGLTWWGFWREYLDRYEVAMALCLVALPYWVNGYDNNMSSMGRYMTVIAPLYPIAGVLLGRAGPVPRAVFAGCGAALMAIYAGLFAQGYWLG